MTYFSVDVETSGTDPFKNTLLTVGVVAVNEKGLILDHFYRRIEPAPPTVWDPDTLAWWLEQNAAAKAEVFSTKRQRVTPASAANNLAGFVRRRGSSNVHTNIFVANPSSFDHAWIRKLFSETGIEDPFSHRTLCLRSAAWGEKADGHAWGGHTRTNRPGVPHHALYDAQAQALDLVEMMGREAA